MEFPLPELLDRFSIVKLKLERIKDKNIEPEFNTLKEAIEDYKRKGIEIKEEWINQLYEANSKVWDLEADIRQGKDKELGLEEIGRRAIKIREANKIRIEIKNKIAEETKLGFPDIKKDHISSKS